MKPEAPRVGPGNPGIRPSPPDNDPHNSREETDAPTSPEENPHQEDESDRGDDPPGFDPKADR